MGGYVPFSVHVYAFIYIFLLGLGVALRSLAFFFFRVGWLPSTFAGTGIDIKGRTM